MTTVNIDVHTHLLPGIDDGADSVEEGLQMSSLLLRQGVTGAVCSPHFDPYSMKMEEFLLKRKQAMELMKESAIPLYSASETFLHESLLYYDSLQAICIENTSYLIVELPSEHSWNRTYTTLLDSLMMRFDITPVIAHIERYDAVKPRNIQELKELGCIFQLNAPSLVNKERRKKAIKYIKKGFVDVLGSDCHNIAYRPPKMREAMEVIHSVLGSKVEEKIRINGQYLIEGRNIREQNYN